MKRVLIVLALFAMAGIAGTAHAAYIIDFTANGPHPAGASISYAGGATPLIGTNIAVTTVYGDGGGVNSGVSLLITGGLLAFRTGNLVSSDTSNWFFGGGGTITITGGVPGLNIPDSTALLTGTFTNAHVVNYAGTYRVSIASFYDVKNEALLNFFDFPMLPFYDGYMNLSFWAVPVPPNAFASTVVGSGDIVNVVPEPGSMLLLGTGLLGLAGAVRRRLKK